MSGSTRAQRRLLHDDGGATAVEFAMVLPLLIVMMTGIFQFGLTQHTLSSIEFSMERAARRLLIDPTLTQADIQATVTADLDSLTQAQTTVSLVKADTPSGRIATLSTHYVARFGVPGLASFEVPYSVSVKTALRPVL